MRRTLHIILLLVALASSAFGGEVKDEAFIIFAQNRTNTIPGQITRVTLMPIDMHARVASLCIAPIADSKMLSNTNANPHKNKYAHVYVSNEGVPAMHSISNTFPKGTIILKEKFSDVSGKNTELFTGMIKREPGYNPECGDWEFFTLSADTAKVTSRGKIKSCMSCHSEYKESDFVTTHYRRRNVISK